MQNPVSFYFWAHNQPGELNKELLERLIMQNDTVYVESATGTIEERETVQSLENDLNTYLQKDIINEGFDERLCLLNRDWFHKFLIGTIKGKNKRILYERSDPGGSRLGNLDALTDEACLSIPFNMALELKEKYLICERDYNLRREAQVIGHLREHPEALLVFFGAAHLGLVSKMERQRPCRVYFPYADYPTRYCVQLRMVFEKEGEIDRDLYRRSAMERLVRKTLYEKYKKISARQTNNTAHTIAKILSLDKILEFIEYLHRCSSLCGGRETDMLESFLQKESLPSIPEVLESLEEPEPPRRSNLMVMEF